ncbi:MAG: DUF3048 domain-containing protein [Ruminococcaceae bacterium]|nr:DUF3048 domain-containing protein [Oscillospiraceae bacterium]
MSIKKIITFTLAVSLLSGCILSSCEKEPEEDIKTGVIENEEIISGNETEENDPEVIPEPEPEPIPEPEFFNPLTGLACEKTIETKRPVAMMINNLKQAIPQLGISNADIIYECIVEGGITRLMAIFSEYKNLPTTGSVRSSRDYYIDLAQAHDAIYAHCGGSEEAYSVIANRKIDNIDGVRGSSSEAAAYWKDQDRVRNMGYEHASMTNGEKLSEAISNMKFRTEIKEDFAHPLNFADSEIDFTGDIANSVSISFSGKYSKSFFSYDENTMLYKKGQYDKAHIDAITDETLTFKNILILGVTYRDTNDEYHHLVMNFEGTGKGYYISNGKAKEIVWSKKDRQTPYKLFEADGETPLLLNPGNSYIGFANGLSTVYISDTDDFDLD